MLPNKHIFMLPQDLMRRSKQARRRKSDGSMKNLGHNFAIFLCRPGCVLNIKFVEFRRVKGRSSWTLLYLLPEILLSREFFVDDNVWSFILYTCEKLITVHKEHILLLRNNLLSMKNGFLRKYLLLRKKDRQNPLYSLDAAITIFRFC